MKNHIDLPAIPPSKERETPAIAKDQLTRKNLQGLLHLITADLKARGTKTPHVFLPYRSRVDDSKLNLFLQRIFPNGQLIAVSDEAKTRALLAEFDEFTLTCALKFLWCRLPNNEIIGWDVYQEFKRREQEAGYPKDAFLTIMPKCLSSASHASIVYDFLDLLISLAANSQYNHLNGQKIAKMASIWAFSCAPKSSSAFYDATMIREVSFLDGLEAWKKRSNGLFHLLLSFLRAMLPDTEAETLNLPKTLQSLLISNTYPPPEDFNPVKSVITIPCVHVRSTRKSADPYELVSKIRHTLRFDKKDSFLSIENYTILKNIFQKESTAEIISTLTEESRRCLARLTATPEVSNYHIYPGWARLSSGVNPNIPLFSEVSISSVTLQDYYIWTWLSSIASDQSTSMKALFGRSIVVEAGLRGFQKWMIITETTILSDEYVSMFKGSTAAEATAKDLPPPPVVKKETRNASIIPSKQEVRFPPPPVEKDSLFSEIATAIDKIGLEDLQPMSDYQVYLNKLELEQKNRNALPSKSLSPSARTSKDRPRPPPIELSESSKRHVIKLPSPKREPIRPEPEQENPEDIPEFQRYKMYAEKFALPSDKNVLEPINDHKKSSDNIPSSSPVKSSKSFEVPKRSERRAPSEATAAHFTGLQIDTRRDISVRHNEEPTKVEPQIDQNVANSSKSEKDLSQPQHSQGNTYEDLNQPVPLLYEQKPLPHPNDNTEKSVTHTQHQFGVEEREQYDTRQGEVRPLEPPMDSHDRSYFDANVSQILANKISQNSFNNENIDSQPHYDHDHSADVNLYNPQLLSSPEKKKKKKKKRKPRPEDAFLMPENLPDGPPPPFPPVEQLPEQFMKHSMLPESVVTEDRPSRHRGDKFGGHQEERSYEQQSSQRFSPDRSADLPRDDTVIIHRPEKESHLRRRELHDHRDRDHNPNDPPPRSKTRTTPEVYRSEEPLKFNDHVSSVPREREPHINHQQGHSQEQPTHPYHQGDRSVSQLNFQTPSPQHYTQVQQPHPQTYPSQTQQYHQQQTYPVPQNQQAYISPPNSTAPQGMAADNHLNSQWQQPQAYGPPQGYVQPQGYQPPPQEYSQPQGYQGYTQQGYPPQGYPPQGYPPQGYAPHGYGPAPQGYGAPMQQPMQQLPPQGFYPGPQQMKPRAKPTTSELTMMNMPMAVGFKKNAKPNKAGMRAALNQGTFGI